MEEEIDLREYIDVIVKRWKLVLGIPFLAVLVAALVSFLLLPPVYEATAQLAFLTTSVNPVLASPQAQLAFLTTSVNPVLASPQAQLAFLQSADVATQTLQILGEMARDENASTLTRKVRVASNPQDKTLFSVTAQATTPQEAAAIANAWATAGIQEMNRKFIANVSAAKEQQTQIALELAKQADEALATFVQSNGLLWDDVAIFEASMSISSPRVVMQGSSKSLNLSATQIADLSRLLRDRDTAASVYMNFAAQVAQSKIAAQSPSEGAQLISAAVEPAAPTQPKKTQNIAIAGVLGLMMGVLGAFAMEYFQKPRR